MSLNKIWIPTSTASSAPTSSGLDGNQTKVEGVHCILEKDTECPSELYCTKCSSLMMDPQQVTCCGKNYCMQCLEELSSYNNPCSHCTALSYFSFSNNSLKRKISSVRVHCPNYEKGCKWVGSVTGVTEHCCLSDITENLENYCQLVKEKEHKLKCPYCSQSFSTTEKLQRHTETICEQRLFTCPHCNSYSSTFRDVMKNHKGKCSHRPVSCPNKCGDHVLHIDLENHMQNDCPSKEVSCEFAKLGCAVPILRSEYETHRQYGVLHHMTLVSHKLSSMMIAEEKMKEEVLKLKEQCQQLEKRVRELEDKSLADEGNYSMVPASQQKHLKAPENVLGEFTMKNVSKLKKEGSIWSSPPFYTSQKGHRLYLQVTTNGHGQYKGKYMSVFIHRTVGEFDDELLDGFQGTLVLQIISGKQKVPNYRVVASIDDEMSQIYTNVTALSYANGGPLKAIPDFANLNILSNYLYKDSLIFRVTRLNL